MMTNLNFKSRQRGTTVAGLGGLALASVLLLCGAGNVPVENFTPQGAMQADLNAGGHSVTNAATVSATNVAAANLTVNGKTLGVNNALTLAGTDGSTLNVGAGGTLGSAAFTAGTAYDTNGAAAAAQTAAVTAAETNAATIYVSLSGTQTVTGSKTFTALQTVTVGTGTPTTYAPPANLLLNNEATTDAQFGLPAETMVADLTEPDNAGTQYIGEQNAVFTHGSTYGFGALVGYRATMVDRSATAVAQINAYDTHLGNQSYEISGTGSTVSQLIHFHAQTPILGGNASDVITDSYGLIIEQQKTGSVANGHGIYQYGPNDDNQFAGPVDLKSSLTLDGQTQPYVALSATGGNGQADVGFYGKNYPSLLLWAQSGSGQYFQLTTATTTDTVDGKLHWRCFNGSFYDAYTQDSSGNSVQIGSATAAGFAYAPTTLTGAATLAVNTSYIWNGSSNATLTLPATCAVGNRIVIIGTPAEGLYTVSKATGQTIYFGSATSYSTVAATSVCSITLVCTVANTSWSVESSTGNFTDTP